MTNFSGENLNAACGGPQGGGMDSRRNGVAEISPKYLAEAASNTIPIGYKQTEVGVIPEDWDVGSIESTCPQGRKYGIVDGPFGSNLKTEHYRKSGIPIISSGFVTEGKFSADDYIYVDESKFRQEKRSAVQPGDIVMAKIGARCGASAILPKDHQIGILSGNALKITVDETRHSTFFIWQILWNLNVSGNLDDITTTGAQPAISMSSLKKYVIPQPPKPEQTAIANALSDVDALISELEKLIAKKQAIKTVTMQQLLTGRTRLPQFALREDGTPKRTKPSELGEVPEDWEVVAMGDLGSTYGGLSGKSKQDFGHGNSLYVPFTNVMANVVVDVDNLEKVDVREAQNNLALGDLLFNGSSETPEEVCFSALVSADIRKLYLNSFCFGFRSNQKNAYLPLYLAYWFRSEVGRAAVLVMAQGSTRYNISKSQFIKLTIVLPDTEEQTAIATILSDMDNEIQALEQRLGKTRQIKQGMMQELLTGKTRLIKPSKEVIHE